jgi:hypothetical protein
MAEPTNETRIVNSKVENEAQQFLYHLGFAITEWAHIEAELFQVCEAIMQTRRKLVAIIYYRTPTLDARLTLTDELILAIAPERKSGSHPHPTIKLWSKLKSDIRDSLPIRNQLAHSPSAPTVKFDPDDGLKITDIVYASYMSPLEQLRGKSKEALKLRDVHHHIASVSKLITHQSVI